MPSETPHQPFHEELRLMRTCPLCQEAYTHDAMTLVEEQEDMSLFHLECQQCHASVLAIVTETGVGVSSVGALTDLSPEDTAHVFGADPISEDDLLSFHDVLHQTSLIHYLPKT